jgi:hypothetical protein
MWTAAKAEGSLGDDIHSGGLWRPIGPPAHMVTRMRPRKKRRARIYWR